MNRKTIFFVSLIAALVLPFSAMQYAQADHSDTIGDGIISAIYDGQENNILANFDFTTSTCQVRLSITSTLDGTTQNGFLLIDESGSPVIIENRDSNATIDCNQIITFDAATFFPDALAGKFTARVYDWDGSRGDIIGFTNLNFDVGVPTTIPDAPTRLITISEYEQVILKWRAPSNDGGALITDYKVEYRYDGGHWTPYDDGITSVRLATVTGLVSGLSYDFRISAINSVGTGNSSIPASAIFANNNMDISYNKTSNTLKVSYSFGAETCTASVSFLIGNHANDDIYAGHLTLPSGVPTISHESTPPIIPCAATIEFDSSFFNNRKDKVTFGIQLNDISNGSTIELVLKQFNFDPRLTNTNVMEINYDEAKNMLKVEYSNDAKKCVGVVAFKYNILNESQELISKVHNSSPFSLDSSIPTMVAYSMSPPIIPCSGTIEFDSSFYPDADSVRFEIKFLDFDTSPPSVLNNKIYSFDPIFTPINTMEINYDKVNKILKVDYSYDAKTCESFVKFYDSFNGFNGRVINAGYLSIENSVPKLVYASQPTIPCTESVIFDSSFYPDAKYVTFEIQMTIESEPQFYFETYNFTVE